MQILNDHYPFQHFTYYTATVEFWEKAVFKAQKRHEEYRKQIEEERRRDRAAIKLSGMMSVACNHVR